MIFNRLLIIFGAIALSLTKYHVLCQPDDDIHEFMSEYISEAVTGTRSEQRPAAHWSPPVQQFNNHVRFQPQARLGPLVQEQTVTFPKATTQVASKDAGHEKIREKYLSIISDDKQYPTFEDKKTAMKEQILPPPKMLEDKIARAMGAQFSSGTMCPKASSFTYSLDNGPIHTVTWKKGDPASGLLTFGRMEENDILFVRSSRDTFVSRIQGFIALLCNKIIIVDSWSILGTRTLSRSDQPDYLVHSLAKTEYKAADRNLLIFDSDAKVEIAVNAEPEQKPRKLVINPVQMKHRQRMKTERGIQTEPYLQASPRARFRDPNDHGTDRSSSSSSSEEEEDLKKGNDKHEKESNEECVKMERDGTQACQKGKNGGSTVRQKGTDDDDLFY